MGTVIQSITYGMRYGLTHTGFLTPNVVISGGERKNFWSGHYRGEMDVFVGYGGGDQLVSTKFTHSLPAQTRSPTA